MFGLFKKKPVDHAAALRADFVDTVRQIKSVEREKQGLVGRGIQAAEESFNKKYSKASFASLPFSEQMEHVNFVRAMEEELGKADGPIQITGIGYGLFNKWQAAVIAKKADLAREIERELDYFKDLADSFSG